MGLVKAFSSALTYRPAPDSSNTALATSAMTGSVKALDAIGKGSIKNSGAINSTIPVIAGKRVNQASAHRLTQRLGQVVADAEELKRLEPMVLQAAKAFEQAEVSRTKMAVAVGTAQQKVAVINAEAQRRLFKGHADASAQVTFHQAAYSSASFGV